MATRTFSQYLVWICFQISSREKAPTTNTVTRIKKNRKKAAKIFNASIYRYRGLIDRKEYLELKKRNIISYTVNSD